MQPLIYAHRGASAHAPENTISAFILAADHRADGIELDVKLTCDDRVIVLHDPTLDRTTNGSGNYKKYGFEELRRLDAGAWFSDHYRGEKIPTLEDVLDGVGDRLGVNIELTNYTTPHDDLVEHVVEILKDIKNTSRIMFSSFSTGNLRKAKQLLPQIPCGLLAFPGWSGWWAREVFIHTPGYPALHPFYKDINARMVGKLHQRTHQVNVWTVNDPAEMRRLKMLGVDMLMTDDPLLARTTLGME